MADGSEKTRDSLLSHVASGASPEVRYRRIFILLCVGLFIAFIVSCCLGRYGVNPVELAAIMKTAGLEQGSAATAGLAQACSHVGISSEGLQQWSTSLLQRAQTAHASIDSNSYVAVVNIRLPRVIAAMLVGAALSVAGASYQGMFQNPMVSQDILGASSGAAFGAALGLLFSLGKGVSLLAFIFGLGAVALSLLVSRMSKSSPILSMILAGMIVSSLFSSGTSFIKLVADVEEVLPAITYWLMGSLTSIRASDLGPACIVICASIIPIFLLRWRMNLLATGEEEAKSMGLNTTAMRGVVIVCATLLTAMCVSISGLIGWVGLVIPHFCRLLLGNDYRRIIPAVIVMGALFLLITDDIARLVATSEIPLGILTSFIGAPVFVSLLMRAGGEHAN